MQIIAVAPGDSDTMATLLGSIIGAYCGESNVRAPALFGNADLDAIRNTIKMVSDPDDIDIFRFPETLMELAKNKCWTPADEE